MRRRVALMLLAAVAIVAVVALTLAGHEHGVEGALAARGEASAAAAAPLPATMLAALPARVVANGAEPIAVTLSAPVSPTSPPPTLNPKVAGTWSIIGDADVFKPVSTLEPCSSYALTVWARTSSTAHAPLGHRRTIGLRVTCPPLAGFQQALARLGYLAAKLRPRYTFHARAGAETRGEAAANAFHPPRGVLAPDPTDAPPVRMGQLDATTRGAIEVYQAKNHMEVTGEPNRATWNTVLYDESVNRRDPQPYTWASVSESLPESLQLHRGHRVVFSTPVNTGVSGAETEQGIFPIYSRFISTTMVGTDVDGTKYDVPDVPWVNYFNGGDAVHGYPRESYGFPQSNGCVELPIEAAHTVYGMLAIGDIVWVR